MSGTLQGGKQASQTIKQRYGADHYARIGSIGGKKSTTGGFGSSKIGKDGLTGKERARTAGARGGRISRRYKAKQFIGSEEA